MHRKVAKAQTRLHVRAFAAHKYNEWNQAQDSDKKLDIQPFYRKICLKWPLTKKIKQVGF